jgi:hypothetical protein
LDTGDQFEVVFIRAGSGLTAVGVLQEGAQIQLFRDTGPDTQFCDELVVSPIIDLVHAFSHFPE